MLFRVKEISNLRETQANRESDKKRQGEEIEIYIYVYINYLRNAMLTE